MKRYLVALNIVQNGKKIEAIRDLRAATGMGLVPSKDMVERPLKGYVDSFGGSLIVNAQQLANLLILSLRDGAEECATMGGFEYSRMKPTFTLDSVEEISDNALDISSLIQLEA